MTQRGEGAVADAPGRRFPRIIHEQGGWSGEFGIIVAGVLCALAAQAWWDGHQERGRDYLRQVLAGTRENEDRLDLTPRDETRRPRAALEAEPGVRPTRDTPGNTPNAAD